MSDNPVNLQDLQISNPCRAREFEEGTLEEELCAHDFNPRRSA